MHLISFKYLNKNFFLFKNKNGSLHASVNSSNDQSGGEVLMVVLVCVFVFRHAAACVAVALVVLHLGTPHGDDASAEETQSGPIGSAGR